jgi:hypothetical protein
VRRYVRLLSLGLGIVLYVWFAAVRSAGEAKARKAARRAARGARA